MFTMYLTRGHFPSVLLGQEINRRLESWTRKQEEVISKLAIVREEEKCSEETLKYVADYQLDAYQNVSNWSVLANIV